MMRVCVFKELLTSCVSLQRVALYLFKFPESCFLSLCVYQQTGECKGVLATEKESKTIE